MTNYKRWKMKKKLLSNSSRTCHFYWKELHNYIYFVFCNTPKTNHGVFFIKSKETLSKSEIPNYHTSILILHDFVGCPTGYFGQNCSKPCVYPSFGERCQGECNCTDEMCNIITGCKGFYQIHNYQSKNRNI